VWREHGPFDGIMGFAQGAAMASMFTHHLVTLHSAATAATAVTTTTTAAAADTTTDTVSSSSSSSATTMDTAADCSSSSDAPPAVVTAPTAANGSTPRHSVKVWVDVGESTNITAAATAAVAAVPQLLQPPQFALFAAGYVYPYPANWPSYPPVSECGERGIVQCSVPSFHYWGVDDSIVPVGESQILAALYRRPTICMRRSVFDALQLLLLYSSNLMRQR
jgi:Serine hydrolase (FSH1)